MKKNISYLILSFFTMIMTYSVKAEVSLIEIQHEWAKANYETPENQQEKIFEQLVLKARELVSSQPSKAEPKVWLAIVVSTQAGVTGGLGALGKVKEAKVLLEEAEKIDPKVLDGSIYTSLGSLYYQVPGWPIGFGKNSKAEEYLQKALTLNPDGIDPNYFYGDFMLEEGKVIKAIEYLKKAQAAPPRSDRPLADKGRQKEIAMKLAEAEQKQKSSGKKNVFQK
ncbi:MAG: tetratricopeptide repeat protein [Gammaproteobacteria bacterium]